MRKLLTFIYTICLAGLILIGSLLLLTVFPIPGIDLDSRMVQSGSMEPAIPTGSVVFIRSAEEYRKGDIITYRKNEQETPTTHRIVEVTNENGVSYTTKGDANPVQDMNEVKEREVLGSVRFHLPFLGYAINFAREPLGFLLLIMVPVVLIGVDEIKKIIRELKKDKDKEEKIENKGKKKDIKRKIIDIVNVKKNNK